MRAKLVKNHRPSGEARDHNAKEVQRPHRTFPKPRIARKTVSVTLYNVEHGIELE